MKHIKNTGRYAISFEIMEGNRAKKIILDKRRIYMDTGNIATTGITSVDDKVYEKLNELPEFKKLVEKGELSLASKAELTSDAEAKDQEIAELKAKLKKVENKEVEKELKAKDEEIASLKAQLEAKGKKENNAETAGDTETAEDEGF
jgi:hypothetical protein